MVNAPVATTANPLSTWVGQDRHLTCCWITWLDLALPSGDLAAVSAELTYPVNAALAATAGAFGAGAGAGPKVKTAEHVAPLCWPTKLK
jgi:hypothetical protein